MSDPHDDDRKERRRFEDYDPYEPDDHEPDDREFSVWDFPTAHPGRELATFAIVVVILIAAFVWAVRKLFF